MLSEGNLVLTDGVQEKFNEKKRHKQKKQFVKEKSGKSKKKAFQSQKQISANVTETASDSEDDQQTNSAGSDSEEEEKKSKKRKKKTLKDETHAQSVEILNGMDPKTRKKLCKFYIKSESTETISSKNESTPPVSS